MAFFGAMQITGLHSAKIIRHLEANTNWIKGSWPGYATTTDRRQAFPEVVAALKGILVTPVQVA
jgi:hypothetical protein